MLLYYYSILPYLTGAWPFTQTHGMSTCRHALASHLERVLCRGEYAIDPEKLIVGAGLAD